MADFLNGALRNFQSVSNALLQDNPDYLRLLVPTLIENLNVFVQVAENIQVNDDATHILSTIIDVLRHKLLVSADFLSRSTVAGAGSENVQAAILRDGSKGRPRIHIPIDQITAMNNLGMDWTEIANFFNVSRTTLWNMRHQNNIADFRTPTDINDDALSAIMVEVKAEHPDAGYRYVWASLKVRGIRVPRHRVIRLLQEIDPVGVLNRRRRRLRRRRYKVKGSNYRWHIDANEKLVSWNMYIHGCVDGHSRRLIYLQLCLSKLADPVLEFFKQGVHENGLPMRVRADHGTENARIEDYMNAERAEIQNPFNKGRSVHNTRIEKMWGEVNRVVTKKFRRTFKFLQRGNVLGQDSLLELLCLWYIYFPRIQQSLVNFKNCWNTHPLSSVNNKTPDQLWYSSLLKLSYEKDIFAARLVPVTIDFKSEFLLQPFRDLLLNSSLELEEAMIDNFITVAEQLVPDPLQEDNDEGISLYLRLRNHFLND